MKSFDLTNVDNLSFFPILVIHTDTEEQVVYKDPKDIPNGRGFKVLKTKVKSNDVPHV
jgi:hypothetical protein